MLLGSAYGKVELDSTGVQKGVTTAVTNLQKLKETAFAVGSAMQQVGDKMTLGVTLPLIAAGGAAIKYASDLNETKNKVEVIFGDMSNDILKWSERSAQALGQSKTEALDAASNFAIFGKAAGKAGQDLVKFSESNVQLAADLASFFNTSPEEAITAIGAAYRGESEPIRKYGVLLSEAALRQKALELGITKTNGPLTDQQRILAANALIFEQTSTAQGDFARTSDGLANSTRTMKAEFKDALATLGDDLLPVALKVVKAITDMLDAFNNLPDGVKNGIVNFLIFVAALGPLLSIGGRVIQFIVFLSEVVPVLGEAFSALGGVIGISTLPSLAAIGAALFPIIVIILAVAAVVVWFVAAWKLNFFYMRDNIKIVLNTIKLLWDAFIAFLHGDTKTAGEKLKEAWTDITTTIQARWEKLFGWFPGAWNAFVNFVRIAVGNIRNFIVTAFQGTNWEEVGGLIVSGLANGLLLGIPGLIDAATKAVEAVISTFDTKLDAHSPSRVFEKRGIWSALGYMQGMNKTLKQDQISRDLARPFASNNNTQQVIEAHFSSGLTTREVRRMIEANNESLINTMIQSFGGA